MPKNEFGSPIRLGREKNGLSQAELAAKIGVSQPLVSIWERGVAQPDEAQKQKLDSILGLGLSSSQAATAEGPSIFGAWLVKTRQTKRLTVPELSSQAGVSIPPIYNIEDGKARNPHSKTVTALEKALGERFERDAELEKSSEIEGIGQFVDFDPHDDRAWPKEAGIYVFYDIAERPIYVGQGSSIAARLRVHHEKFWFRSPIVYNAAYIQVADKRLREQIETILIKFLKSNAVINKQQVDREES